MTENPKPQTGRGGAGRGQGRKPNPKQYPPQNLALASSKKELELIQSFITSPRERAEILVAVAETRRDEQLRRAMAAADALTAGGTVNPLGDNDA